MARGAADGLDQRGARAQIAFLVGVEHRHQRAFRDVEPLAQQVDADQHVEDAEAQVADDLDALQRVDVGMHVAHPDAVLVEILGQRLGHLLGQRRHQHALALQGAVAAFRHEVVDLVLHRPDETDGIDQAGGPHHLLDEDAAGALELPRARRRRDADRLAAHRVPLLEFERPVVDAGRQAEAVLGERRLAGVVAAEHAAQLRDGDVALVAEDQRVLGQVLEQGRRRLARLAPGEIARIVLDAGAAAGRRHHLDVEGGALLQPLRLEQLALRVELLEAELQVDLDLLDRLHQRRLRRDVVAVGIDGDLLERGALLAGQRIEFVDRLELVAEQREPPGAVLVMRREDLDRVAARAEGAADEIGVVAAVLQLHQLGEELGAVDALPGRERERHLRIGLDRADAVDAGDRGDDHGVAPLEDGAGRRMAHAVDLLVDRGFLLDIGVGPRHIGLGLVVVVVGDEILDRVLGEEALHLAIELRRQRLVGSEDERRALGALDDMRHGEGLARAGDPEQHLIALAAVDAGGELDDRLRLVARGLELGMDDEALAALGRCARGGEQGHGS